MTQPLVIVVVKRSVWSNRLAHPQPYESLDEISNQRAKESHERQHETLNVVLDTLNQLGINPWIVEGAETAFLVGNAKLVISVGGDGTFLSASHNVPSCVPMLGVNSDPIFSVGNFCCCDVTNVADYITRFVAGNTLQVYSYTRMRVMLGTQVYADRILNEVLYSHSCPAAMTKFTLNGVNYSSSGVWIGTGAGSTGAMKSAGGVCIDPEDTDLQAVVREPWAPGVFDGVGNIVKRGHKMTLKSRTLDSTLFIDGPFLRLPVGLNEEITLEASDQPLALFK